jgi:hypothetical protein
MSDTPWDASMPLRASANGWDIINRYHALASSPDVPQDHPFVIAAREYAEARTEALRLALFECATVGKRDRESAEATIGRLRAELASLRAAQPDVSTVETVDALVVAQETAVRAREELARIEVLPALGRRPADPTHGERHRRIAETERAQLSRLLHLRLEIALARAIMAAFPDAVLNEPRNTPDYVGAGAGEGNASIEGSPIRDPV